MSKQQKQILLLLLKEKPRASRLRLTEIITQMELRIQARSSRPHPNAKIASFSRSMRSLKDEGLVANAGRYWYLTKSGLRKVLDINKKTKQYIQDAFEFRNLIT